jgi:hypothetical protein
VTQPREPRIGDRLLSNDPRAPSRERFVVDLLPNGVVAEDGRGTRWRLLRKSVHTDGRPRRSGWSVVPFP